NPTSTSAFVNGPAPHPTSITFRTRVLEVCRRRIISGAAPRARVSNATAWTYARSHWYSDSIEQILAARLMICKRERMTGNPEVRLLISSGLPIIDNPGATARSKSDRDLAGAAFAAPSLRPL